MINKIFSVYKPINYSSAEIVNLVRAELKIQKIGHAGTLDPFASGVLIICTGNKTKMVEAFMNLKKEYHARIKLGKSKDTLDLTGKTIMQSNVGKYTNSDIKKVLKSFMGEINQIPPHFSALKVNSIPLYKFARKDIFIRKRSRKASIYNIEFLSFKNNVIELKVKCSRGTYIRSLARDICNKLNTIGYLESLERLKIGNYSINETLKINKISEWMN